MSDVKKRSFIKYRNQCSFLEVGGKTPIVLCIVRFLCYQSFSFLEILFFNYKALSVTISIQ